jgi:hypothetical protein
MTREVLYKAIDPYYSDFKEVFIGSSSEELDEQQFEFEKWLGREYSAGIMVIYESQTIKER